jgi:hypothetical protein
MIMGDEFPSTHVLRHCVIALCLTAALAESADARAEGLKLDSREYKLMLEPAKFQGKPLKKAVDEFWEKHLVEIIEKRLDRRSNGKPRHKDSFKLDEERHVVFRDTAKFRDIKACVLKSNGYVLRERVKLKDGQPGGREITLKFRTPDLLLAATAPFEGAGGKADKKFEEDLTPQIERRGGVPAFAQPPASRSLFSASVKHKKVKPETSVASLKDVMKLYPGVEASLRRAGMGEGAAAAPLASGEKYHEIVFSKARVDLGENTDAEFDLTFWYRPGQAAAQPPVIAEVSFKYDMDGGKVAEPVARRAAVLFRAMQEMLGGWTSAAHQTKTSMALPEACPRT